MPETTQREMRKLSRKPASSAITTRRTEAQFEAWLEDFDRRMAGLTQRQDALLRKLGIDPIKPTGADAA